MKFIGFIYLHAFFLNVKVLFQCIKKLRIAHAVQVLYHAVIVDDVQLVVGEAHRHEEVVLLIAPVVGVLAALLVAHQRSGG